MHSLSKAYHFSLECIQQLFYMRLKGRKCLQKYKASWNNQLSVDNLMVTSHTHTDRKHKNHNRKPLKVKTKNLACKSQVLQGTCKARYNSFPSLGLQTASLWVNVCQQSPSNHSYNSESNSGPHYCCYVCAWESSLFMYKWPRFIKPVIKIQVTNIPHQHCKKFGQIKRISTNKRPRLLAL